MKLKEREDEESIKLADTMCVLCAANVNMMRFSNEKQDEEMIQCVVCART